MASPSTHVEQLERHLLRRGVGALEADRYRCADCGRTPLIGEHVHLYAVAHQLVCELCRPLRREAPDREQIVRHCETATPCASPPAPPDARCTRHAPGPRANRLRSPWIRSASRCRLRPREQVFDYLQDIANHAEFTDHYLVDWHLTREDSVGRGAGARFRVKAPGNRFSWGDVTFTEVERAAAHRRGGPRRQEQPHPHARRLRARAGAGGHTRVSFTLETRARDAVATGCWRASARARWLRRKNAPGDAPAARDPRARTRAAGSA